MKNIFPQRLEPFLEKHRHIILVLIFLGVAGLYLSTASNQLGGNLGGDNARYIMLARSLADGKGYRDTYLPGEPLHIKYPFVFSAMLAPLTFIEKNELLAMHLLIASMAVLVPFFIYGWMRSSGFTITASLALLIVAATIPRFFGYLLNILSEIPFMFFVYLAFLLLARSRSSSSGPKPLDFITITIVSILALFTRTIGICLVAAILIEMVINPSFRKARLLGIPLPFLYMICFAVVFGAWSARNHIVGGIASSYLSELLIQDPYQPSLGSISLIGLISRFLDQALDWIPRIGLFFDGMLWMVPGKAKWIQAAGILLFLFIAYGLFIQFKKKQRAEVFFFIMYLIVICLWPFQEGRFHLPILPFAMIFFFVGVYNFSLKVSDKILKRGPSFVPVALAWAVIFLYQAALTGRIEASVCKELIEPSSPVEIRGYGKWDRPIVDWRKYEMPHHKKDVVSYLTGYLVMNTILDEILPEDAIVLTRKPAITAFFSDRKATRFLFTHNDLSQWRHIKGQGANYILGGFSWPHLDAFVERNKNYLEPLLETQYPDLKLYRIKSYPVFGSGERGDK